MQLLLPIGFTFITNVYQTGKTSGWNIQVPGQLDFQATILLAKAAGYKRKVEFIAHPISQPESFCHVPNRRNRFLEREFCASIPYPKETGLRGWMQGGNYLLSYMAILSSSHSSPNHQTSPTQSFHPSWTQLIPPISFDSTNRLLLTRGRRESLDLPSVPVKSVTVSLGQL